MPIRFRQDDTWLWDFSNVVLVKCPTCSKCAQVISTLQDGCVLYVTLTCAHCGHIQRLETNTYASTRRNAVDGYFGCPLWLQTPCARQVLWANNADHLNFLEQYIGADLRERVRGTHGWRNTNLASRLPEWMQKAKHHAAVLRGITVLRAKLVEAGTM